jgi:S1-C subfamily serine protease
MKITGRFTEEAGGRPIEEGFRDSYGAPADGTAAFFPIIQMREQTPWVPIGTGFFISNNGLFATAKHVVLDERGQLIRGLAGVQLLRKQNRVIVREAKKIVVHPQADVAIGFLFDREFAEGRAQTVNKCFALTRTFPELGSKVVTIAFPKSELTTDQENFTLKFTTSTLAGTVEAYHPKARDLVILPGRCFQTDMSISAGASGGPVAFGEGCVFGINSTGMEGVPVGFISSVEDIFDLEVERIKLPNGEIRDRATVHELVELGLVPVYN